MAKKRSARTQIRRRVRYGVVGLGHIAQAAVLPAFAHATGTTELAALFSSDPAKLRKLGRKYGVEHRFDYGGDGFEAGLLEAELDAVYIALPNNMHREYTERAAAVGVHVLCEKPMAVTSADCRAMTEACDRAGVKLMIAYRLHFDEANLRAVDLAQSGKLGDLRLFSSVFTMDVREGDIRLSARQHGGGTLYDIGVYCINAARYLFREEPEEVFASSVRGDEPRFGAPGLDEMTAATLRFPGGRLATFVTSFGAAHVSRYQIVGTDGDLVMDPAYSYAGQLKQEIRIGKKQRQKTFPQRDQFAPELAHFAECVMTGVDPEPSGREGLADIRVVEALYRSADSGRPVRLDEFEKRRRPGPELADRRPAVREPELVNTEPPQR